MTTTATIPTVTIAAPELRGAAMELGRCRDMEVCLDGPAGCVAGETRLYNPITGEHTPIKELYKKRIAPIVQTLIGAIQADVPFVKGVRDLFRVTLASGRQCIVTGNHLFLTPDGWRFASSCSPGSHLLVSLPCPQETIEELGPLVSQQDAYHLSQIPLGSQERYSVYSHHDDEPPLWGQDNALDAAPSQGGALSHSRADLCGDDRVSLLEYTRHSPQSDRHAKMYYSPSLDGRVCTLSHVQPGTSLPIGASFQYAARSQQVIRPLLPIAQPPPDGDSTRHRALLLVEYRPDLADLLPVEVVNLIPGQLAQCFLFSDTSQGCAETLLETYVYNPSMYTSNTVFTSNKYDYSTQWDTVSSIKYERTDEYFDLHVPIAEHYLAEGIWHHNTGKTFACLYKVHILLTLYPGAKALVARKSNVSLAGSAMATFRNLIQDNEGVTYFGGNKVKPAAFEYNNGSLMIVSGLDRPEKIKSYEFDVAYLNEASEMTVEDLEFVRSRLRNGKLPYHQVIMDTNPDAPSHWLNQRMSEGLTTRLISRHEENPRFYDIATQDWTEEGRKYIFEILGGLTGVRLARLRYGIWAAASGTIYEQAWDRARNVIDPFPIPRDWPRYLSIDFGFTHPFVCLWAAMDHDGRLYVYRQIYMTRRLVEDHAKDIKRISRWGQADGDPFPRDIITDHAAQERATLEKYLELGTTPAHKTVLDGIQAVATRFQVAGDGKPRLMIFRDCLVERDRDLAQEKRPTCLEDEPELYIWRTGGGVKSKEEPVKEFDHALDALRYLVAYHDLAANGVSYFPDIWT